MDRDKNLHWMLLNKETPEPSDDLEDRVMIDINKVLNLNSNSRSYLFLAWIFFVFSIIAGVMISTIWINLDSNFLGLSFLRKGLIMQIFCPSVLLLLFERLYRLTIEMKNKDIYQQSKLV